MPARKLVLFGFAVALAQSLIAQPITPLPQTSPLTNSGDLSAQMVAGIDRWLMRETASAATNRARFWKRDFSSRAAYEKSVARNRETLRKIIGAVDGSEPPFRPRFDFTGLLGSVLLKGEHHYAVSRVQWPVFEIGLAEGIYITPVPRDVGGAAAMTPLVIVLPDADQTPEMIAGIAPGIPPRSQFARHLAMQGYRVLIPALVSRDDEFSGNEKLKRFTNQPHREWIYRQAYELGRHVIGYEVQKVIAAIDRLQQTNVPVAVAGYGEGGLIALYAAALDTRINAALVSGYFAERERLWSEPIYRNVFGLLREFGDAEIASLIAPRKLLVEYSKAPNVNGPPPSRQGRSGAAPGIISTPEFSSVESEVERANELTAKLPGAPFVEFIHGSEGAAVEMGSAKALSLLASALGGPRNLSVDTSPPPPNAFMTIDPAARQQRTVKDLERLTQQIFRDSERARDRRIWSQLKDTNAFLLSSKTNREFFWREVIGKLDAPKLPVNPRTRKIYEKEKWTGYEVMLDVFPDVFAWGYLLLPKDLKPDERRPVVVCQHGLEGVPEDTVADDTKHKGYGPYKAFAAKLAERGYIVYAPHNPYRGQDKFRVLQRKANPLGLSLFSFIIAQHEVTTDWLASLPFVDPQRIAFYGLSYGGKTAMRVPAVVERYCLSICSADFNEWVQKCVTTDSPYSYMFTGEYEMPEWDLGHTFNYAEMASLIAPRPFMVERGHDDGVAPDSWVAYEYAKIRRMYNKLGIGDRTEIEFFDGPHTINGVGTFKFLDKHLGWPERKNPGAN